MEVHLHFGMHRDIQTIHDAVENLNGLIVPAHILAHQPPSTSAFVTSLAPHIPYLIDPVTYRLQSPREKHLNRAGDDLRASTRKLAEAYHPSLSDLLLHSPTVTADLLPSPSELVPRVLAFQREFIAAGSRRSAAKKYLDRYTDSAVVMPRSLVPPYFFSEYPGDPWYQYSLDSARTAAAEVGAADVTPVVFVPLEALKPATLRQIDADYREFPHLYLWVENYHENFAVAREIALVRKAIQTLKRRRERVEALYGGYLLLLAEHDGLTSVAHGILYTQHKSRDISGAGDGGAAERYYIPGIRQFRSLSQSDLILHKHPELICPCHVCAANLRGDPNRIVVYADNPHLLREHFLAARALEARDVSTRSLFDEAARLRKAHTRYDASIRALPNPDAFISGGGMKGLDFLLQWAEGITTPLE